MVNELPEDWNDLTEEEKQNLMSLMAGLMEKNAIKRTDRLELLKIFQAIAQREIEAVQEKLRQVGVVDGTDAGAQ